MKNYLVIVALSVFFVGCTSIDPYTGQQKTSNTAKGVGLGVLAGAILGAATGKDNDDRKKRAAIGAAAGGATGAGVGYYMDRQEATLRQRLQGTGVQVRREGDNIQLIMPGDITFATGRYEIRADFYEVLNSVTLVLNEFDNTSIKISGHTDSTGGNQTNQTLSEQRANSVRGYLAGQRVATGRIQTVGYGPRYPIASNSTASGRQANRRVELELLPM
jgi:outer membrane protein OmpA-like peptidoglycan-associated protein|tara:strand:+ start:3458 stop:4111 length:654 start_codon:yes stop_codon:yes gene_type:complete